MKKNYLLSLAFMLLITGSTYAQSIRNCGTMQHLHDQEMNDPGLSTRMENIERETKQWIGQGNVNKGTVVVTIPVVVHVVYNTSSQNISDAQINSQIAILNQDFRKLNADISIVPSAFSGLAADCEIQFCLAQRDPNGNATNGIVRKSTTVTSFSSNDNIKRNANGGSDPWNTSAYLNIWVGNLSGGLLGYAQFPGGSAATDGVVILYTAFGNTGVAAAPFNKGRTATHEIGHWLNLRHIWGDATCGNDQVSDTPTQQTANYGCPSFPHVTCSNGPNGDMFMNYMDYTDDACMVMFSAGQKTRMLASLNTTRASLLSSLGCVPPSGTTCATPSGLNATGINTTAATLNWLSVSGALSYNIQYRVSGTTTWNNSTAATNSKAISGLSAGTTYEYQVQTVCTGQNSSYSSSATFTTASASCTDSYEGNNSKAKAKTIPVNSNISAKINTNTDKDWFKFTTVAGSTNVNVVLDLLPADYDMKLYNAAGSLLTTSQSGGTAAESIIRNSTSASSYFIQVYGYNGAYNTASCYRLRINTSGSPFRNSDLSEYVEGNFNVEKMSGIDGLNLFPNPANTSISLQFFNPQDAMLNAEVLDVTGRLVLTNRISATEGFNTTEISTVELKDGIYFLRLSTGSKAEVRKFMIKH